MGEKRSKIKEERKSEDMRGRSVKLRKKEGKG